MHHSEHGPEDSMLRELFDREAKQQGLGATGQFPAGKIDSSDEGEIQFAVGHIDGKVMVNFGKPVAWVGMTPEQARGLALVLRQHANQCGQR